MKTKVIPVEEVKVIPASQSVVPKFEISVEENKARIEQVRAFVQSQMQEGEDYGKIPGVDRPSLLKPGAEKLCNIFGFGVEMQEVDKVEEWDKGLFAYTFRAVIRNKRTGLVEAECIGSCNSKESKYAYRWIPDFKASEQEKARSDKQEVRQARSGKSFTWFRVPNDDIYSQVNTLQKMAQKRAMVGAVLIATRASGFLTQDMEDTVPVDADVPPPPQNPAKTIPERQNAKPAGKQDTIKEQKLKIGELLQTLGVSIKSAEQCKKGVQQLTDLELKEENYPEIISRLLVRVQEDKEYKHDPRQS